MVGTNVNTENLGKVGREWSACKRLHPLGFEFFGD